MTTEIVSNAFTGKENCFSHTWLWVKKGFEDDFRHIINDGLFREDSGNQIIWKTRNKYTIRIVDDSGKSEAFKYYRKLRLFPYLYHASPVVREAANYQKMADLGFPMAKLLAVGEKRRFFRPLASFIMTEFAEDYLDGRVFYPDGSMSHESELRDDFCRRNFRLLAKLHDAGFYHRGFTPANELWRMRESPDRKEKTMELIWIDVATCRKLPAALLRKKIPEDFVNFLRFYRYEPEEYMQFIRLYCEAAKVPRIGPEELFRAVRIRLEDPSLKRHH